MTRREMLIFVFLAIAMIAAGLTWIYGPWALAGTGAAILLTVLTVNERKEDKPDA